MSGCAVPAEEVAKLIASYFTVASSGWRFLFNRHMLYIS